MTEEKSLLWLWLSLICAPGTGSADRLLDYFGGSVEEIYSSDEAALCELPRLSLAMKDRLLNKSLSEAKEILSFCGNEGIGILTPDSPLYPSRLGRIKGKPVVLYYRGILRDLEPELCIAEVGTRRMSEYGKHYAYEIAYDLAKAGAAVVSGMAKGIDGMAHRGAIDAGGYTVAVLGCGIDRAYPAEHTALMQDIIKNGLVISEYKPFTPPVGRNFPIRNRIVTGLCQGTVVIEAPPQSGAMISAKYAEEQGRDIFAVPGKVGEYNSVGTNQLIKQGARMIISALDIIVEYQPLYGDRIDLNKIPQIKVERTRGRMSLNSAPKSGRFDGKDTEKEIKSRIELSEETMTERASEKKPDKSPKKEQKNGAVKEKPVLKDDSIELSSLTENERMVMEALIRGGSVTTDKLFEETGLSVNDVLVALTMLEITGRITALPGGAYTAQK